LPRRRATKQFICHHVRLKWKSDLLAISYGAVERIVPSHETDPRRFMAGVIFMTRRMT
jgi:hypothetical protein